MHINENHLGQPLSLIEQQHLLNCSRCNEQHKNLSLLKQHAHNIELLTPPPQVWFSIKNRQTVNPTTPQWRYRIAGFAASTILAMFGYLMFNNYQLQQQVEQVVQINQSLEIQLMQNTIPTFQQAKMLSNVRNIEYALIQAQDPKEKIRLLKQRQKIISNLVESQTKGENHVFQI